MEKGDKNDELEEIFENVSCQCELQQNSARKIWKKHMCRTKSEITFKDIISGKRTF